MRIFKNYRSEPRNTTVQAENNPKIKQFLRNVNID